MVSQDLQKEMKCGHKGPLGFLVLWVIAKNSFNGVGIADELEQRKGSKPSPGTVYPILKELKEKMLIKSDTDGRYSLTEKGKRELKRHAQHVVTLLHDFDEIKKYAQS